MMEGVRTETEQANSHNHHFKTAPRARSSSAGARSARRPGAAKVVVAELDQQLMRGADRVQQSLLAMNKEDAALKKQKKS